MRNRAKCKKCLSVIESFFKDDYVACKCSSIAIAGGTSSYEVYANDFNDFLRVDDQDNEIVVKVEGSDKEPVKEGDSSISKKELIDMLDEMQKSIERLPQHALVEPISHYELSSLLLLLSAIFRCKSDS